MNVLLIRFLKVYVKKYETDTNVLLRINEVFNEQIKEGIIEEVVNFEEYKEQNKVSFLSFFPLLKEERQTTKLRIIYMANLAEKQNDCTKGLSINNCVFPGFNKNFKISDSLTLFRFDKYVLAYDISKAFHRLAVSDHNSSKLLFYWYRDIANKDFTPVVFRMRRLVFGHSCSPFLLTCALYKMLLLEPEHGEESEEVKKLKLQIYQGSYVDNISVGCRSEKEIEFAYNKSVEVFARSAMPLQQFVTNCEVVQGKLDMLHKQETNTCVKILGMSWNRLNDTISNLKFKMNLNASTKRLILKKINSAYDLTRAICLF